MTTIEQWGGDFTDKLMAEVEELQAERDRLTEQLEDARRWAVFLEQLNAAAAALHVEIGTGMNTGFCDGCEYQWPCPTADALGAEPAPAPTDPQGGAE